MLLLALLSHRVENMKKIQFCFPTFPISCPFILLFLLLPFLLSFLPISLLFPFPYLFSSFPSPSHLPSLFPLPFFRTPPYFPSASIVPHLIFFLNSLILFHPQGGGEGTLYTPAFLTSVVLIDQRSPFWHATRGCKKKLLIDIQFDKGCKKKNN